MVMPEDEDAPPPGVDEAAPTTGGEGFVMGEPEFREIISEAVDALPEEYGDAIKDVGVLVEDRHDPDDRFGQYQGSTPRSRAADLNPIYLTVRGTPTGFETKDYGPDLITLYRLTICEHCRTRDEVVEQTTATLLHEIGHFFGMSEEDLRRHEAGTHRRAAKMIANFKPEPDEPGHERQHGMPDWMRDALASRRDSMMWRETWGPHMSTAFDLPGGPLYAVDDGKTHAIVGRLVGWSANGGHYCLVGRTKLAKLLSEVQDRRPVEDVFEHAHAIWLIDDTGDDVYREAPYHHSSDVPAAYFSAEPHVMAADELPEMMARDLEPDPSES
jgi:predicted Zn-dependent protease with MMP-like domain